MLIVESDCTMWSFFTVYARPGYELSIYHLDTMASRAHRFPRITFRYLRSIRNGIGPPHLGDRAEVIKFWVGLIWLVKVLGHAGQRLASIDIDAAED